jgi:hypothetical protein
MPKMQILFSRVLEDSHGAQDAEDELNRLLAMVEGEIIGFQIDEIQKDKEFRLFLMTR